jgi:hypothetical protein
MKPGTVGDFPIGSGFHWGIGDNLCQWGRTFLAHFLFVKLYVACTFFMTKSLVFDEKSLF